MPEQNSKNPWKGLGVWKHEIWRDAQLSLLPQMSLWITSSQPSPDVLHPRWLCGCVSNWQTSKLSRGTVCTCSQTVCLLSRPVHSVQLSGLV